MAGTEVEVGESGMGFIDNAQYTGMLFRLEQCAMGSSPEFAEAVNACFEQEPVGDMGPFASATATALVDGLMETPGGALRARAEVADVRAKLVEAEADMRAKLAEADAQLATLRTKGEDGKPKNKGGRPPKEGISAPAMIEALDKHFEGQVKNLKHVKHADLLVIYREFGLDTDAPRAPAMADLARINKALKEARGVPVKKA